MKKKGGAEEPKPLKVILLGESGVGKTSIILRYLNDQFDPHQESSNGLTYVEKNIKRNNITYKLNIWDTMGQEKYHSMTKLFIKGADIVILVYSIDKEATFKVLDDWYQNFKDLNDENVVLGIVGNKYDLFDNEEIQNEKVKDEDGEKYAKEKKAIFKLVSAKIDKKGIDSLFENLLDEYINKKYEKENNNNLKIGKNGKNKKKKCC